MIMAILFLSYFHLCGWGCSSLVEHRTVTLLTHVQFPGAARKFSPRVNFQCRLSNGVHTPPCAIACINICAHMTDPVVHVRVQWIVETLKQPAFTVGWEAWLSSWLSQGKATQISHGRYPIETRQLQKKKDRQAEYEKSAGAVVAIHSICVLQNFLQASIRYSSLPFSLSQFSV